MKTYYLIKDHDGTRFVPSDALCHFIPCTILGILQMDEIYVVALSELKSFNEVVRKFEKGE